MNQKYTYNQWSSNQTWITDTHKMKIVYRRSEQPNKIYVVTNYESINQTQHKFIIPNQLFYTPGTILVHSLTENETIFNLDLTTADVIKVREQQQPTPIPVATACLTYSISSPITTSVNNKPIETILSNPASPVILRSLPTGLYILQGSFQACLDAELEALIFSSVIASIEKTDDASIITIYEPGLNDKQKYIITDTSWEIIEETGARGFTILDMSISGSTISFTLDSVEGLDEYFNSSAGQLPSDWNTKTTADQAKLVNVVADIAYKTTKNKSSSASIVGRLSAINSENKSVEIKALLFPADFQELNDQQATISNIYHKDFGDNSFRIIDQPNLGSRLMGPQATTNGFYNIAAATGAVAMGVNQVAAGTNSATLGAENKVLTYAGIAFGKKNIVFGLGSPAAIGNGNVVLGENAFSAGYNNEVTHAAGAVFGQGNKVNATHGFSTGKGNTITGIYAAAIGNNNEVKGSASVALGISLITTANQQFVHGAYNIEDNDKKYLEIVGNGSAKGRSNAYTLDKDGNAWFAGDLYTGGESQNQGAVNLNQKVNDLQNNNSNTLKGAAKGEVVVITDMSPIEHDLSIQVSGENSESAKIIVYGKNLCHVDMLNENTPSQFIRFYPEGTTSYPKVPWVKNNTTYTLSANVTISPEDKAQIRFFDFVAVYKEKDEKGDQYYTMGRLTITSTGQYRDGIARHYSVSITTDPTKTIEHIYARPLSAAGEFTRKCKAENIQIEVGSAATKFEEYTEPTVYTQEEAIRSIYPSTTLFTDTAGTMIECEYNRDLKQKVNFLQNNLSNALQGAVRSEIVAITDISPVEHELGVKVASKNLAKVIGYSARNPKYGYQKTNDYGTTISTTEAGNSIIVTQKTFTKPEAPHSYHNGYFCIDIEDIEINAEETITVSFDIEITRRPAELEGTQFNMGLQSPSDNVGFSRPFTIYEDDTAKRISFTISAFVGTCTHWEIDNAGCDCIVSNLQVEKGTVATDYTPYASLEGAKLSVSGKNLCPTPTVENGDKIYITPALCPHLVNNTASSFTMSADVIVNQYDEPIYRFFDLTIGYTDGSYSKPPNGRLYLTQEEEEAKKLRDGIVRHYSVTVNVDTTKTIQQITMAPLSAANLKDENGNPIETKRDCKAMNIQLEMGSIATEYEPYIEPVEYDVYDDGYVEGVKSIYPNTTLTTNTANTIINVEYNRDINKAFAELQNAILSLGGNV